MKLYLKPNDSRESLCTELSEAVHGLKEDKEYVIEIKKIKSARSDKQRNAIELYCRLLAEKLEESGISRSRILEYIKSELPWSEQKLTSWKAGK